MGRSGSWRVGNKVAMWPVSEAKPRMRLALGGDKQGLEDPSPGGAPRKVSMRRADPGPGPGGIVSSRTQRHSQTSTHKPERNERTVASRTCSVGCQTADSTYWVGCQAAPAVPSQECSAHQRDDSAAALAAAMAALDEHRAQSAAREAELRAELAAARERVERAAAEGEQFIDLHMEYEAGCLLGPEPRARVAPDADSPQRPDAAALTAAPCTPSQSPERSNAELTPAPSSPGADSEHACPHVCEACKEVLFIDNVCYWVAAFAPKAWAPVCVKSARFVLHTRFSMSHGWKWITWQLGQLQSMGAAHPADNQLLGPAAGWIYWHYRELHTLKNDVWTLANAGANPACIRWLNRWVLHLDVLMNTYEELRLKHKALYLYAHNTVQDYNGVISTLLGVLKQHDANNAAAVDAEGVNV